MISRPAISRPAASLPGWRQVALDRRQRQLASRPGTSYEAARGISRVQRANFAPPKAASSPAEAIARPTAESGGSEYRRVIVKLSGEALQGGSSGCSVDPAFLRSLAQQLAEASQTLGVRIGVVVGGGNHLRGADALVGGAAAGIPRPDADGAGMLGTLLNGVLLRGALEVAGVPATLLSALPVKGVAGAYDRRDALAAWARGHVLVLAAGTGNPFFTTDTAAALRAADLEADIVLKATKVDGVYDRDPVADPRARRFETLSFRELLVRELRVLDATAATFCRENRLPLTVFDVARPGELLRAIRGDPGVGTRVLPDSVRARAPLGEREGAAAVADPVAHLAEGAEAAREPADGQGPTRDAASSPSSRRPRLAFPDVEPLRGASLEKPRAVAFGGL